MHVVRVTGLNILGRAGSPYFSLTDMPFQMHIMIFYHKLCKNYKVSPVNLGKVGLPGPAPFTIRHFLLECGDFAQERNNCFHVDNMK